MKRGDSRPVYLVDDDEELRQCLSDALADRGFVVAGFESGRRFLAAWPSLPAGCVLADLRMDDGDGFELLQGLRDRGASFPVIVVTGFADIPAAVKAMKLGAVDIVEKPFSLGALVNAIDSALVQMPVAAEDDSVPAAVEARNRLATLTRRERDVLEGVVKGWTNRTIAQSLSISQRTVELHRAHLMDKLGARSVSQLVRLSLLAAGQIAAAEPAV